MWRAQSKPVLSLLLATMAAGAGAWAAPVPDLYVAQVPTVAFSGPALGEALALALDEVLVKVTGQRSLPADPTRRRLIGPAAALVRQYQPVPGGQVRVGFDPATVRQRLDAANLPVWADERPRTLVILPPEPATGPPGSPSVAPLPPATASGPRQQLLMVATSRGVPLVFPADPAGAGRPAGDPLVNPAATLAAAGADVLLLGRPSATGGSALWRWTMVADGERTEWQGDVTDGAHGLADRLAARYATAAAAGRVLRLRIEDVNSFDAYGRVQSYLRGVDLIQRMELQRISGGALVVEIAVRGDISQLNDAFALQRVLEPVLATSSTATGGEIPYRLVPAQ